MWAGMCPPSGDCHLNCCSANTHWQWGIGDLAGKMSPNSSCKPGFGVQPAETRCEVCPIWVGTATRGHTLG